MTSFACSTNVIDQQARVVIHGALLNTTRAMFSAQIDLALGARVGVILLDLSGCPSIDSAGMGALVSAAKRAREHECRILLEGLDPDLRETFRQTKLDTLFDWPVAAVSHG